MADENRRRWLRALAYVAVCVLLGWLWLRSSGVRLVPPERAPAASRLPMRDLNGARVDLGGYAGQVVVVNVWASWCGPCRAEIPAFSRVYERYRGQGLEILGLNVEDLSAAEVDVVSRELGIRYPVTIAAGRFGGTFTDPAVIPHSWFIDRDGRVRGSHSGVLSESALRQAVERLLRDPPSPSALSGAASR